MPPAQMRMIFEGLHSPNARRQYAALVALGDLPSVAQSQRERIERLATGARDARVRRKAAALLASLDAPPAAEPGSP